MILSKLHGRMQQAVMVQTVNVLSPVIGIVGRADAFHSDGRQYRTDRIRRDLFGLLGVLGNGMLQDGYIVNLGELKNSYLTNDEYVRTSQIRQGRAKGSSAVGAIRSTLSTGKPRTWGRDCRDVASGSALGFPITLRMT